MTDHKRWVPDKHPNIHCHPFTPPAPEKAGKDANYDGDFCTPTMTVAGCSLHDPTAQKDAACPYGITDCGCTKPHSNTQWCHGCRHWCVGEYCARICPHPPGTTSPAKAESGKDEDDGFYDSIVSGKRGDVRQATAGKDERRWTLHKHILDDTEWLCAAEPACEDREEDVSIPVVPLAALEAEREKREAAERWEANWRTLEDIFAALDASEKGEKP